jgi:hypothetical protein
LFISSIAKNETYRYHDVPEVFYFDVRFLEMPQVYLLLSCCPCEGRISGIVDVPNACATLAIPITIFDQDIRPKKGGPLAGPRLVKRGGVPTSSYDGHLPTTLNHAFAM